MTDHWTWLLLIPWFAWWLWGVNWKQAWTVLTQGGWMPLLLLMIVSALVWSQIAPSDFTCFGLIRVPNFWWQLGCVSLLVAGTLLCGWLQGVLDWAPAEIQLEPVEAATSEQDHSH